MQGWLNECTGCKVHRQVKECDMCSNIVILCSATKVGWKHWFSVLNQSHWNFDQTQLSTYRFFVISWKFLATIVEGIMNL